MFAIIKNGKITEFSRVELEGSEEIEMTESQSSDLRDGEDGFYTEGLYENGTVMVVKTDIEIEIPEEETIEPEPEPEIDFDKEMLEISNKMTTVVQAIKNTSSIQDEELKTKTLAILESKRANLEAELSVLVSKI